MDRQLRQGGELGDGDRQVVDRQAVVATGVVDFRPAQPERGGFGPRVGGEVDRAATVLRPAGGVSIHSGSCAGGNGGGPVKVVTRCYPGGHLIKAGAVAVFQHHRLGGSIAAVAPLLAVEGDVEAADGAAAGVAEGQGKPAGHAAAGWRAEITARGTDTTKGPIAAATGSVAQEGAGIGCARIGVVATDRNRRSGRLAEQKPARQGLIVGPGVAASGCCQGVEGLAVAT